MFKKILIVAFILILILVSVPSFLIISGQTKVFFNIGTQKTVTKNYDRDFRRLNLDFPADFSIKASSENKVVINGGQNVLEFLNISQTSRTLSFSSIKDNWFYPVGWTISGANRPNIVIYTTKIEELIVSGDSKLSIQNVNAENINLEFSSKESASISQLNTSKATIKNMGSGFIDISGKTDDLIVETTSSGRTLLRNFESKNASVKAFSSSTTELFITQKLTIEIGGTGPVKYKGSPEIEKKLIGTNDILKL